MAKSHKLALMILFANFIDQIHKASMLAPKRNPIKTKEKDSPNPDTFSLGSS